MIRLVPRLVLAATLALITALPARAIVDIVPVTSPGGIEAWLVEDHSIPFVALEIRFRGGYALDPEDAQGVGYLMTGLLEEGAADMDARAYAQRTEALAADFDFDISLDTVSVSAKMLSENRDAAVEHLRAALIEPRFDEDAIERVRAQIQSIIASNAQDPGDIANARFDAIAFPGDPYGRTKEGTRERVAALTRDDIVAAHLGMMARDRVYVGAAGDITAEELGLLLDRLLGDLPATGLPVPPATVPQLTGGITVVPFDTPQSVAIFGHEGMMRDDPDYIPAFILNQIVGGGGFSSRLMTEVREERGLTYGIGSYLVPFDRAALYMGQFSSDNSTMAEAIAVVQDQWADIATNGITAEELEAAKTYLTGAYPLRFDGNGRIANILVGMQMADLGLDYIPTRNDQVNAVTLDEINAVAARSCVPTRCGSWSWGGPRGFRARTENILPTRAPPC